ncbi:universal stress protein [bacterium]|nr:universal stress protein [bacterium]
MFENVLVAADGSMGSDHAVRAAIEAAAASHAKVTICHVFHLPEQYRDDLIAPLRDAILKDGEDILAHAVGVASELGVAAESRLVSGKHPAEAILDLSKEIGADLIVLGARGRTTDGSREIGSVGSTVVTGAKASVLIVRRPAPK